MSLLPEDPKSVLIGLWLPGDPGLSVHRVDLLSGNLKKVVRAHEGVLAWSVDHQNQVRVGWGGRRKATGEFLLARTKKDQDFETVLAWDPAQDKRGFEFAGFSDNPRAIYVFAPTEDGRKGIFPFDLEARPDPSPTEPEMAWRSLGISPSPSTEPRPRSRSSSCRTGARGRAMFGAGTLRSSFS